MLIDLTGTQQSTPLLDRLLGVAAQPVHIDDLRLQVSASVGVTHYPQTDEVLTDQLLRQADQAMYKAKVMGKNRYHMFDVVQDAGVKDYYEDIERIRSGLKAQEFLLYYQPKVNMCTGTFFGAEALIRWQHPVHGLLLPGAFLPLIEDNPLSAVLDEWVLNSALSQLEDWISSGFDLSVRVNVGARFLQQPGFVERLRTILQAYPSVKSGCLELEVLGMASAFHRPPIAEGVETIEHGKLLLRLGCELAQGYAIARPMPANELPDWVTTWRPDPAWSDIKPVRR